MAEKLQINLTYNKVEDRLLLRISGRKDPGCSEFMVWITRRFANVFIAVIDRVIEEALASDMQVSPDSLEAMKKFQREAALAKADFSTLYGLGDCSGKEPFLVSVLKVRKKARGRYVFSLLTDENAGVNLVANIDLLHSLRKMLLDLSEKAQWDKPLSRAAEEEMIMDGGAKDSVS